MNILNSVYPFRNRWLLGLLPHCGSYNTAKNIRIQVWVDLFSFLLCVNPGVGLLGHMATLCLII